MLRHTVLSACFSETGPQHVERPPEPRVALQITVSSFPDTPSLTYVCTRARSVRADLFASDGPPRARMTLLAKTAQNGVFRNRGYCLGYCAPRSPRRPKRWLPLISKYNNKGIGISNEAIQSHAATSSRVTASHPNSEVKLDRVQVVLRWGTTREGWMLPGH